jgi:tetratricopeptide (TPR) repeat protein
MDMLLASGTIALELGQHANAQAIAEKALARDRDCAAAWRLKSASLEKAGNAPGATLAAAMAFMAEGALEAALGAIERACTLDARYAAAWCNRAVVLERLGRLDDAARSLERALELDPGSPVLWHNMGNLLLRAGRREDAVRAFRREVKLDHRRWFDLAPEIRAAVDAAG